MNNRKAPFRCTVLLGRTLFIVAFPKVVIQERERTGKINVNLTVVRYIQWQLLPLAGQMKYTHFDGLPDHRVAALGNRLFFTPINAVRETCLALGAAPTSIP
jgi:hypothetical protein